MNVYNPIVYLQISLRMDMCAAMVLVYKNQEILIAVTKCLDILLRTTIYLLHLTNVVLRIVYQGYWINV